MIEINPTSHDKIVKIIMYNNQLEIELTNYGCTILKFLAPDKFDKMGDVVLGYDSITEYQQQDGYLGAIVGRVANRIKKGKFILNGIEYSLAINNGPNHLHGGIEGFSYKIFDYLILNENSIRFTYISADMEEGYPGELTLNVIYTLSGNSLMITYNAYTTKDTIINITNHSYFNLSNCADNICQHSLRVDADEIACIDEDGLPTGKFLCVKNTPFDFNEQKILKEQINKKHEQMLLGKGIDHPFIFKSKENQVELFDTDSGRKLTVSSTLPGAQIYTGNFLDGRKGKDNKHYFKHAGICIETQNLPDAIHIEKNPSTILRKNDIYEETTIYTFNVIK